MERLPALGHFYDDGKKGEIKPSMRLTASSLGVNIGKHRLLNDISLTWNSGEFIGILGPSGSGKSTLLNALSGRRPFQTGEVLYDGQPLTARAGTIAGFVPQDDTLHTALKTDRLLMYSARLQFSDKKDDDISKLVSATLRAVGLEERAKLKVERLSGGQRKRVSIAMELLQSPKALFLDEPTSGLDPELEKSVMSLCARLAKEDRLIVMTTHVLESITLFDRLLFLVGGETAFFGTLEDSLQFFGVPDVYQVYSLLAKPDANRYATRFRGSTYARK